MYYICAATHWRSLANCSTTYIIPMKKTLSLALSLFLSAFLVASCDDLTTIKIPFGITTEHEFDVEGTDMTINQLDTVNLTENYDFNKNKNKIKEAAADSIQIRVTEHFGSADQTLTGEVKVGPTAESLTTLAVLTGLNLTDIQTRTADGSWITVETTPAGRQKIADLIKVSPHTAILMLTGSSDAIPNFKAHFKIHWKMEAEEDVI